MSVEYVTVTIGGQLFGAAVGEIHDVFSPSAVTPGPLAPREVAGVLNLRGRIVTMIDMRARLGLPGRSIDQDKAMAVGVERGGEMYGLIVDAVGEVMRPDVATFEANPVNMDQRWAELSRGVHRLEKKLLVVLDVDRLLKIQAQAA